MATRSARASATSSDPRSDRSGTSEGRLTPSLFFCGGLRAQGLGLAGRSEEGASHSGVRARHQSGSCIIGPVWQLPSVNQRERIIKGMHLAGMTTDARNRCIVRDTKIPSKCASTILPASNSKTIGPGHNPRERGILEILRDTPRPLRAVKPISRSQWNGGFGAHCGPSRGDPCRRAVRPRTKPLAR